MLKQKVFFFAAKAEASDRMAGSEDLRLMAIDYVRIYGDSCLSDPDTPAFIRQMHAGGSRVDMPAAS